MVQGLGLRGKNQFVLGWGVGSRILVQDLGFRVQGLELRIEGSGFEGKGFEFWV